MFIYKKSVRLDSLLRNVTIWEQATGEGRECGARYPDFLTAKKLSEVLEV